jgi:hypothetical protein
MTGAGAAAAGGSVPGPYCASADSESNEIKATAISIPATMSLVTMASKKI